LTSGGKPSKVAAMRRLNNAKAKASDIRGTEEIRLR
jgi:hypothetical protein